MMKWTRETKSYMWANYYSEDGVWLAYDTEEQVEGKRTKYNPITRKFEKPIVYKHYWILENLVTGERIPIEFKSLKAAKEYAENQ